MVSGVLPFLPSSPLILIAGEEVFHNKGSFLKRRVPLTIYKATFTIYKAS